MDLKTIAGLALDEAGFGRKDDDSPISVKENPDGTVTYSVFVALDPKVQKEMAKALPKGTERDDLADELGVFSAALDEIAEDAPSRYSQTPLENCRAKDPMFCPYHGDAAIRRKIEDGLVAAGLPAGQGKIDIEKRKGGYQVSVTVQKGAPMNTSVGAIVANAFADPVTGKNKNGISLMVPDGGPGEVSQHLSPQGGMMAETVASITPDENIEVGRLDEWIDGLVSDIAADPTLQNDLDPNDVRDLLEAREALENVTPVTSNFAKLLDDAKELYHSVRAQVDFRGVKTPQDVVAEEASIDATMKNLSADFHKEKSPVDAAKAAIFPKGRFPNGFSKAHPWAAEYSNAASKVGYFAQKLWDDAQKNALNVPPSDIPALRTSLGAMKYASETYAEALNEYKKAVPKFINEFKDWAMNDPNVQPSQFKAAFPHSSPHNTGGLQ